MTDLSQYQPDHLFLLIGKNPLPNYVAAKVLGKKGKTHFYLIYSSETKKYAESLNSLLQKEFFEDCTEMLSIEESNPESIKREMEMLFIEESNPKSIKREMKKKFVKQGSVGLNYTGGTKVMSIHSYLEIKRLCKDKNVHFSYLNPRKLELCFDDLPCRPFKLGDPDNHEDGKYFETASIKLEDLLKLHNQEIKPEDQPRFEPDSDLIYKNLLEILATPDEWKEFIKNLKPTEGSKENSISTKDLNSFLDLRERLNRFKSLYEQNKFWDERYLSQKFQTTGKLIEWLQGKWLEDYVLKNINELKDECNLHDCKVSLKTKKRNSNGTFFELDVVTLRGYQLFAISCTTSHDKPVCKGKLFEAFVRSRQLGGDEARVALVCSYKNSDELRHELEKDLDTEKQIKVFGKNELSNLKQLFKDWFNKAQL